MKVIKIDTSIRNLENSLPEYFTGKVEWGINFAHIAYVENGKFHKTDGPAIIHSDGQKFWYIYGHYMFCASNSYLIDQQKWFDSLSPAQKVKALFNPDNFI